MHALSDQKEDALIKKVNIVYLLIAIAYLLLDFIPARYIPVLDIYGAHWLYLACLNLITIAVLAAKNRFDPARLKNSLTLNYLIFGWLALVSVLFAFNPVEWLVTWSRLVMTIIVFLNFTLLLTADRHLYRYLLLLLVVSGGIQAIRPIWDFFNGLQIHQMYFNLGNKNILAASLMIKLAIAFFSVSSFKRGTAIAIWLCMALMITAIFVLSARTSILGMIVMVLFYLAIILATKKLKTILLTTAITLGVFLTITFQMDSIMRWASNAYKGQSVVERILSVKKELNAGSNDFSRPTLWRFALDYISKHPLTGGGYGNWKIHSIQYESSILGYHYISRHAHNDFLEVAADTGIAGGLAYISLFILCAWYLTRIIRSHRTRGTGLLFAAPFAALMCYGVDAMFNFPLERANMQLLFGIVLAMNIVNYRSSRQEISSQPPKDHQSRILVAALLLLSVGTLFISWKVFESLKGQFLIRKEMEPNSKAPHHSFADIAPYFSFIPNISEGCVPIAHIRAKYLLDEGRIDEAYQEIISSENTNPWFPNGDLLLAEIYKQRGNSDSAFIHYQRANDLGHIDYQGYAALQQLCVNRKDSNALEKNFRNSEPLYPGYEKWTDIALWTMHATGNLQKALAYLEEGSKKFPANTVILFNIHYLKAYDLLNKKQFRQSVAEGDKALSYGSSNPALQNQGLTYFGLGEYTSAISCFDMAIIRYGTGTGESVFLRGECKLSMGNQKAACIDFLLAIKQGYAVPDEYLTLCK